MNHMLEISINEGKELCSSLVIRKSKLDPRKDSIFQVLECINNNVYKIDLLGEYVMSTTFNVVDLSLFDASKDSRIF